ncbi:hypothetical protein [Streptomyces yanii]|uniref:Uncharacterized protein n=1 Tax=Streptomyces yanii TaxID=78510 RepID=A0ABV5QZA7_9ACTN
MPPLTNVPDSHRRARLSFLGDFCCQGQAQFSPAAAHRRTGYGFGVGGHRWVAEAVIALLDGFRCFRFDREIRSEGDRDVRVVPDAG